MLKVFKKDIITNKIVKEKNNVINKGTINNDSTLTIHKNLEKMISNFYNESENKFDYGDLIKRKNRITKYNSTSKEIGISFLFGVVGSLFISAIIDMTNLLNGVNATFSGVFMILFILLIVFGVLYLIMYFTKFFADIDKYHIKDFEIAILDELIEEYEKK